MDPYQSQYADLHFERAGLFRALLRHYPCTDVLYPGCSIHLTPSLFFPHVVYVDTSELAARFFADQASVSGYISRHKHYKRSAYHRFIHQDYLRPLPLMEGSFDLLLALFAAGISQACKKYLKRGGLLISNNHQNDALTASRDEELRLIAIMNFQAGRYLLREHDIEAIRIPVHKPYQNSLRQTGGSVEYIEHETYYIFERK